MAKAITFISISFLFFCSPFHPKQLCTNPWTMSQCISTDWVMTDCFSFWAVWLGCALPSFLPSRFQLCLTLVSWASSQRRGRWWAWTTSNTHQTLQPEDRQEPWSSARLYHCLSWKEKNWPRTRAAAYMGVSGRWGGTRANAQSALCQRLRLFSHVWTSLSSAGEKMRISELMSSGNCILIHLPSSLLVRGNYKTQHMPIFQREKVIFRGWRETFHLTCV